MTAALDSFVNDSVPDKIGREASVVIAGISQGLYAAATNIAEHPIKTAAEVATGVAVGALTARVAILKLPMLAITVAGGLETALQSVKLVDHASPAVAEIWRDANVSAALKPIEE